MPASLHAQSGLRESLEKLDKDGDGRISKDEIKSAFGDAINEDYMRLIFSEVDENGDGQLTFPEFLEALKKTISARKRPKQR